VGSVRLPKGGGVLKAGDERKLAEAELGNDSLKALTDSGAISGFVADDETETEGLPPVREMKEFLSGKSRDEVEQMAATDERTSVRPYYEARLAELDEEEQA
jgi:hypothetical protein